jgi:HSP20 family molecular chaperone IbpA
MASFIRFRPFVTNDLLLCHKMLDIVPREESSSSPSFGKSHQVNDTDKVLEVSLDLPGVKASDLSVTTHCETIHISGARRFALDGGKTIKKSRFEKTIPVDTQTISRS